ncbi:MAG: transcriptional repressor [Lentisphaeria bacterium]|nr:transcriptional repressor [Lentisphaeria bacterium]
MDTTDKHFEEFQENEYEELERKFNAYVASQGLRWTKQREVILKYFLKTDRHVSAQDLYDMVRETNPEIGYATVSRTMKLFVDAGISWVVDFNDGVKRYDHLYGCMRHDHIICIDCNTCVEVVNKDIEAQKKLLARNNGFELKHSKLDIFASCTQKDCPRKKEKKVEA